MKKIDETKNSINSESSIAEIAEKHPDIANYLVEEYGFHCTSCFLSEFENFEDGAMVHGISGVDFEDLLKEVNEMVAEKEKDSKTP